MEMFQIREAAESGDPCMQLLLGFCSLHGFGIAKNEDRALEWYLRAAEQKFAPAQYALALVLEKAGKEAEALRWCTKAANAGYAPAQALLGLHYHNGLTVAQDAALAFEWTKKAADLGYLPAIHTIASYYEQGFGVGKDLAAAKRYFRKAAEQGYIGSAHGLAHLLLDEGGDVNVAEALTWIQDAAKRDDVWAMNFLCQMYGFGLHGADRNRWLADIFEARASLTPERLGL